MKTLKHLFLSLLMITTLFCSAQKKDFCGTRVDDNVKAKLSKEVSNLYLEESSSSSMSLFKKKIVKIPVVFHVLYTDSLNCHDSLLRKQIEHLNEAYRMKPKQIKTAPKEFKDLAADMRIEFYIDQIIRVKTRPGEFYMDNNGCKFDSLGGSNVVSPETKLNIWVCQLEYGLLGYSQFPGDQLITDGLALDYTAIGAIPCTEEDWWFPYSEGDVAVHEIGHWLGLFHIWGDDCGGFYATCMGSDDIDDTPNQACPTRGCPNTILQSCGEDTMYMNYMDYTDNQCMYMFTKDQVKRARAVLQMYRKGFLLNK